MYKLMTSVGISCLLLTACAKSNDIPQIKRRDIRNSVLEIKNCQDFVSDKLGSCETFYHACEDAGMKVYNTRIDTFDKDIYVTYIYDEYGYAAIWINEKEGNCLIEFCINEECPYDYEAFLDTFLAEFYTRTESNERHQNFLDLLD